MRVLHFHQFGEKSITQFSFSLGMKKIARSAKLLAIASFLLVCSTDLRSQTCDNVINGGTIQGDEFGCPNPTWDPSIIQSVSLPTGGSGSLEFLWIFTTDDPTSPISQWTPIPGSNSPTYDPGPIATTTYYRRCARRSGCMEYVGESNYVTKEALCCDNVTDGGTIGQNQLSCTAPFDPALLTSVAPPTGGSNTLEYQWVTSTTGTQYSPTNPDWVVVAGANSETFDPTATNQTTYYIRLSRRYGCFDYEGVSNMVNVTISTNLAATATTDTVTCLGGSDGAIDLSPTGGTSPYSFEWSSSLPAVEDPQNLAAGTYSVTVTDDSGCTTTASAVVLDGIQINVTTIATPEGCAGVKDGSAAVFSILGGVAPYQYAWNTSPVQITSQITNLGPGSYSVVVTDDQGCTGSSTATVDNGDQVLLTISHTNATCNYTTDGTATVTPSGGEAPYDVVWSDSASQTTNTASNLPAGTYSVSVTDANGCTATGSVTVEAPLPLEITTSGTNVTCFDGTDGTVAVTVVNGNPNDYNYIWDDPNSSETASVAGLAEGTYNVTVTDNNGCLETASITIFQPSQLTISMTATDATCGNGSDGTATALASGGTPFGNGGYDYVWDAQGNPAVNVLDDVTPGTYTVTATDANGCTITGSVTIGAPPVLEVTLLPTHISCFGFADGKIASTVTGGTAPYGYSWNDPSGSATADLSGLAPGFYSLLVTDAVGCSALASVTITEPSQLGISFIKNDVVCPTDTDGALIAQPTGGTLPYSYLWDGPFGATGSTLPFMNSLGVGIYHVVVTDGNGCTIEATEAIVSTTTLAVSTTVIDATCYTSSNGSATAVVTGGAAPFTFTWNNGETTAVNDGLSFGNYAVTVVDADGCEVTADAIVAAPPQLFGPTSLVSPITTYGGSNGSVAVAPTGGTAPYTVLWSNGQTTSTIANLSSGTYSATVTDANGCTITSSIFLQNPSKIGNFVWHDLDQDGVQDANEPGLDSIKMRLTGFTIPGVPVSMITYTDTLGFYAFDGLAAGTYRVRLELPAIHVFSPKDVGSDLTDSDFNPVDSATAIFNLPINTYDSRWDAGLIELDEKINIGDFVWQDVDKDGIQDPLEQGYPNMTVRLYSMPSNTLLATKITDASGKYLFTDVFPGFYQIEFPLGNLPNGSQYSAQNQGGNDNLDSDPDPLTGRTATFQVFPYTVDNLTIDAGVYKICDNVTDGGTIGYNEALCGIGADPSEIISLSNPSGGFGTLQYLWLSSNVPIYNGPGDPNWSPIPNSNNPNYDPSGINQSTYYVRCSRREGCITYPGETNVVSKTITPNPLTQIIDKPANGICVGVGDRFEAAIAGGGATYEWNFGVDANPATANTRVVNSVSWTSAGLKTISLTVTRFGCSLTVTTTVQVNNCPDPLIVIFDNIGAVMNGNAIELTWSASGFDAENTVFIVQRSEDGLEFSNLNAVAGTDQQNGIFRFTDHHPGFGENIYRVEYRQTGQNPGEGTSPTATAMFVPDGVRNIHVYPNPTYGIVTVQFVRQSSNPIAYSVVNAFGQVLLKAEAAPMAERAEIDLSRFATGVYYVHFHSDRVSEEVIRLVKSE